MPPFVTLPFCYVDFAGVGGILMFSHVVTLPILPTIHTTFCCSTLLLLPFFCRCTLMTFLPFYVSITTPHISPRGCLYHTAPSAPHCRSRVLPTRLIPTPHASHTHAAHPHAHTGYPHTYTPTTAFCGLFCHTRTTADVTAHAALISFCRTVGMFVTLVVGDFRFTTPGYVVPRTLLHLICC